MTHDDLERRLRAEASPDEAAWAARPLPRTIADARASLGSPRRGGWLLSLATATAVVVVAAVAWAVTTSWLAASPRGVGDGTPATASPSASTSEAPATTPSPSPSAVPALGPCTTEDVAVASDPWGGAAGSRGTTVVLRIVDSTSSCALPDVVTARITDATGATLLDGASDPVAGQPVAGGTQLEVGIAWSNWCEAEPVGPLTLELRLGDDASWIPAIPTDGGEPLVPPCMGSGQPTNLSVTGLQPSERPPIEG